MRDPARRWRSPVGHRHEGHEAERQAVESTTEERATTRAPSHGHGDVGRVKTNVEVGTTSTISWSSTTLKNKKVTCIGGLRLGAGGASWRTVCPNLRVESNR